MLKGKHVAVVIPAYNEERLIARTIGRVPDYVDYIVVVDDGSADHTHIAATVALGGRPGEVIRQANAGVGAAIRRGYRAGIVAGADILVVMAGDDQMDPADLPALVEPVIEGSADYVKGNRLAHPLANDMPGVRRFGTRVLARATALVAGVPLDDSQCGYTAISSSAAHKVDLDRVYPRYGYPNDLILRLSDAGLRIAEVPVRPVYADEVSGLAIHKVIAPISKILIRGAARKVVARTLGNHV